MPQKPQQRKLQPKETDRTREIVARAKPIFLEKGYEATSMAEIAAAVGGSKATLYAYFSSKDELFEAFVICEVERRAAMITALPLNASNPAGALGEVGRGLLKVLFDETVDALERIVLHEVLQFPALGKVFYETGPEAAKARIATYLKEATAAGRLAVDDPDMAAEHFILLCQAKLVQPFRFRVRKAPRKSEIDEVVDAATAMFMKAYGVR